MKRYLALLVIMLLSIGLLMADEAKIGVIFGKIVDQDTGEPLIGVNILIDGTIMGAATDIEGAYRIERVPAGIYSLKITCIGYQTMKLQSFELKSGEVKKFDIAMQEQSIQADEVVVEAKAVTNTEASLLKNRQKSTSISDAISSEAISRRGSGNAADAMTQVTGASVVGGKYIVIRGLGERYTSTHLNGIELPSTDPDKKTVHMDLFPGNMLENIVTKKTFTPDQPGNFSGGIVDIGTKTQPEKFSMKFSSSMSYNSQANFNNQFLTYQGGNSDWLGVDDGIRDLPEIIKNNDNPFPTPVESRFDKQKASTLDQYSKAFNSIMTPNRTTSPINQSYMFSIGNQIALFNRPLGFLFSLSYKRNLSFYDNGKIQRWQLNGTTEQANALDYEMKLNDHKSSDEALVGNLMTASYKLSSNHIFSANWFYTHSGEKTTRFQSGEWPDQLDLNSVYETRSLLFIERSIQSLQMNGQHLFLDRLQAHWNLTRSTTAQDDPDLRFFSNDYSLDMENGDTTWSISKNLYNYPTRFYRSLEENNTHGNLKFSLPVNNYVLRNGKISLGMSYGSIDRAFTEKRYEVRQQEIRYMGNDSLFFDPSSFGIIDSANNRYRFGNYISDCSDYRNNYSGDQAIHAGFFMVESYISSHLRFITGVRYETTDLTVTSQDTTALEGAISTRDWLPSLNFVYELPWRMNLRLSYGRTLARPNFREMAPFRSFEFIGDYIFEGNPHLKRTLIDNYDFRWEWFINPGEILAVSTFYKQFRNPIERTIEIETNQITYQNVPEGRVWGAEFEARRQLGSLWSALNYFAVSSNLSLIHSQINIPADEYQLILKSDVHAKDTRPLFGQSPYLFNIELAYDNPNLDLVANLYLNLFGSRLSEVTMGATPDVFEQPQGKLDFSISKTLLNNIQFRFGANNILDAKSEKTIKYKGKSYLFEQYARGRSFSFGISYAL